MSRRQRNLVKPDHLSADEWLIQLRSERAEIMRQIRKQVHTRGMDGSASRRCDMIDRAIAAAFQVQQ